MITRLMESVPRSQENGDNHAADPMHGGSAGPAMRVRRTGSGRGQQAPGDNGPIVPSDPASVSMYYNSPAASQFHVSGMTAVSSAAAQHGGSILSAAQVRNVLLA